MINVKREKFRYMDFAGAWLGRNILSVTIAILGIILLFLYFRGFERMLERWNTPEYSFGYFIPIISIYLIMNKRSQLVGHISNTTLPGIVVLVLALCIYVLGELSTISVIVQYSFIFTLYGIALVLFGWRAVKIIIFPLLFLFLMIPLPEFLYNRLSSELQLVSSQLGVFILRLFGVSVFLEGNVVDLGSYKLQVVEACSGLKYLFSLFTISILLAYLYRGKLWLKCIILLLAIPITILMNSIRIAITGVLVEHWGTNMADGFMHQFEGLLVFAAALILLLLFITLLNKIFNGKKTLRQAFQDTSDTTQKNDNISSDNTGKPIIYHPYVLVLSVLLLAGLFKLFLDSRDAVLPNRSMYINFPQELGVWKGKRQKIQREYIDSLKFDDYIMSRYVNREDNSNIVFYAAYYKTQKQGESAHSPKSCLPGGGWRVSQATEVSINLPNQDIRLNMNRVLIKRKAKTQLVYYWFKQRGRNITNEYLVKWYLFLDALRYNRTDGALIRLSTSIKPGETIEDGDARLKKFAGSIVPILGQYVPD